jgi:hypothetical protein
MTEMPTVRGHKIIRTIGLQPKVDEICTRWAAAEGQSLSALVRREITKAARKWEREVKARKRREEAIA